MIDLLHNLLRKGIVGYRVCIALLSRCVAATRSGAHCQSLLGHGKAAAAAAASVETLGKAQRSYDISTRKRLSITSFLLPVFQICQAAECAKVVRGAFSGSSSVCAACNKDTANALPLPGRQGCRDSHCDRHRPSAVFQLQQGFLILGPISQGFCIAQRQGGTCYDGRPVLKAPTSAFRV